MTQKTALDDQRLKTPKKVALVVEGKNAQMNEKKSSQSKTRTLGFTSFIIWIDPSTIMLL